MCLLWVTQILTWFCFSAVDGGAGTVGEDRYFTMRFFSNIVNYVGQSLYMALLLLGCKESTFYAVISWWNEGEKRWM